MPRTDFVAFGGATQIGFMGCHAMLNALRIAHAITAATSEAMVLICAVELCSLHQQYGRHAGRIVANSLFADGAAASSARPIDRRPTSTGDCWPTVPR